MPLHSFTAGLAPDASSRRDGTALPARPAAPYRALVVGATGAAGGALLRELRHSEACLEVVALTRRPLSGPNATSKVRVQIIDFHALEEATREYGRGCAVAFCTMGIGQPRRVPFDQLHLVDVYYAGVFARGAAEAGVRHLSLVSSVAASHESKNPYLRIKAAAEDSVTAAAVPRISIFRPSLLRTRYARFGLQDRVTQAVYPVVARCLPARYRAVHVEELGRAMRVNAEREGVHGVERLEYPDFRVLIDR